MTNAYVSGMKQDLNLGKTANFHVKRQATTKAYDFFVEGNELNWFTTYFNIGIIVGGPFITMSLTVIKPRYLLPACTLVWSFFVLFMYKVQDAKTLYVLR